MFLCLDSSRNWSYLVSAVVQSLQTNWLGHRSVKLGYVSSKPYFILLGSLIFLKKKKDDLICFEVSQGCLIARGATCEVQKFTLLCFEGKNKLALNTWHQRRRCWPARDKKQNYGGSYMGL